LLLNGIAVVQLNCAEGDSWDWGSQWQWDSGQDRPFLRTLFRAMKEGSYGGLGKGVLNPDRLSISGYSVGAQMVSWMMQLHGTGALQADLGATLKAGALFAGGTYACYRYPPTPPPAWKPPPPPQPPGPLPINQCASCNVSNSCMTVGCSNDVVNLTGGSQPCCSYCCPANFTEQHYADNPEDYPTHPPSFLVQHSTLDENADACASRNYHATMLAHGGRSELALIAPEDERCYCVGVPNQTASKGSPLLGKCAGFLPGLPPPIPGRESFHPAGSPPADQGAYEDHSTERCVYHTMGHAAMVEPLTRFLLRYL
jgi:hypothetical protein